MDAVQTYSAIVKGYAALAIFDSLHGGEWSLRNKPQSLKYLVNFVGVDNISRESEFKLYLRQTMKNCGIDDNNLFLIVDKDHADGPRKAFGSVKVNGADWAFPLQTDPASYGDDVEIALYRAKSGSFEMDKETRGMQRLSKIIGKEKTTETTTPKRVLPHIEPIPAALEYAEPEVDVKPGVPPIETWASKPIEGGKDSYTEAQSYLEKITGEIGSILRVNPFEVVVEKRPDPESGVMTLFVDDILVPTQILTQISPKMVELHNYFNQATVDKIKASNPAEYRAMNRKIMKLSVLDPPPDIKMEAQTLDGKTAK